MSTSSTRRLIWIYGRHTHCQRAARNLLRDCKTSSIAWLDVPGAHARRQLGQTRQAGVIDAHQGLDPDEFGAVSGAIIGGGALIMMTPAPANWLSITDSYPPPWLSDGLVSTDLNTGFIKRLIRHLQTAPFVEVMNADQPFERTPIAAIKPDPQPQPDKAIPNAEQQVVIDAITQLPKRRAPSVIFISADRGRGKSAALGMAIKTLKNDSIRVSGPSRAALASVAAHAGAAMPEFLPPEHIQPHHSLLMIDEAAALPLGVIHQCLNGNPHCVLTGTVHGYEGSGRGLTLRLAKALEQQGVDLIRLSLHQPLRFPAHDPLEQFTDQLLLLRAEPPAINPQFRSGPIRIQIEAAASLANHEQRLEPVFAHLVAAHYQTRPRDLRQLLDDPEIIIHSAWVDDQVVGVSISRPEGGFSATLTEQIYRGERRPAGHLIAQSLTFHAGISQAAMQKGLRIQRIAVHPDQRRCGIGLALIAAARELAVSKKLDWLGTSFGASAELLDFWQQTGLKCVRVGNRLDPRSGSHAVIMLEGLSQAGRALFTDARHRLAVHLPDQAEHSLARWPQEQIRHLMQDLPSPQPADIDRLDLHTFATGQRRLLDSHGALKRWLAQSGAVSRLSSRQQQLLRTAVANPLDTASITTAAGTAGWREALAELRKSIQQGLSISDE